MINNKLPPSQNKSTLPPKTKQTIMINILQRKIKQQDFLNKMYVQQINSLRNQKQELQNRFLYWERQGDGVSKIWEHNDAVYGYGYSKKDGDRDRRNDENLSKIQKDFFRNNSLKFDQSLYFGQSPTKISNFGKKKFQTPIRKLQSSNSNSHKRNQNSNHSNTNNQLTQNQNLSKSPKKHYSKISELQKQIKQLTLRISQRQSSKNTHPQDQICLNLQKKIEQQQRSLINQLTTWKNLQTNINIKKQVKEKIQRMKEEIFKQNQSIRVIKIQNVNRNKEIVKYGYTGRMGEVIESYGGVRK